MFNPHGLTEETVASVAEMQARGLYIDFRGPGAQPSMGPNLPVVRPDDPTTYLVTFQNAGGRKVVAAEDEDYATAVSEALRLAREYLGSSD